MNLRNELEYAWLAGVVEQKGSFHVKTAGGQIQPGFRFTSINANIAVRVNRILPNSGEVSYKESGWGESGVYTCSSYRKCTPEWFLKNVVPYLTAERAKEVIEWAEKYEQLS